MDALAQFGPPGEPISLVLAAKLADEPADEYIVSKLLAPARRTFGGELDLESLATKLSDGEASFRFLASNYLFPKHSFEASPYGALALVALETMLDGQPFEDFLESEDLEALWLSFAEACEGRKLKEQENRPLLEGLAQLNMDVLTQNGEPSLFQWLEDEVLETHRVDHLFERLTEIRGLGPKNASTLLRDAVLILDLEDEIRGADRHLLQPIHASIRRVSAYILPTDDDERTHDWELATGLAGLAREAGISGVRLNMGALQVGAADGVALEADLKRLLLEG